MNIGRYFTREGAEMLIFYIGMASNISTQNLLTGIGTALVLIAVIGYLMLRMNSRIPRIWRLTCPMRRLKIKGII
jgi:high-affinity Fe2+/Pb2+ permease